MKICTVKFSAKETKWTLLEVRTHPTFLEILISKYDFGPVKLPGLSRYRPQGTKLGGVEVEEKGKKERNWKVKESYSLLCTTVMVWSSWRLHESGTRYGITKSEFVREWAQEQRQKSPQRKLVYYNAHERPFVFRYNVSSFSHRRGKTFCLFPANLATTGNMTTNSVI